MVQCNSTVWYYCIVLFYWHCIQYDSIVEFTLKSRTVKPRCYFCSYFYTFKLIVATSHFNFFVVAILIYIDYCNGSERLTLHCVWMEVEGFRSIQKSALTIKVINLGMQGGQGPHASQTVLSCTPWGNYDLLLVQVGFGMD